ncbi:RmlC-like cupin, partial [Ramicandelaber brevisporus]
GFQLWVNLPAKDKMIAPRYQDVPPARIPEAKSADGRTTVKVISGTVGGVAAVIDTHSPITFLDVRVQPGAAPFDIAIPHGQSGFVYVFGGDAAGARFGSDDIVKLHHVGVLPASETASGDATLRVSAASAQSATQLLVVVGKPLNEPIARYGPFVMNTDEQLMQAFADYR